MARGRSRISEGAGGSSQLWFRALWDRSGEGEDARCRRNFSGLQAVPHRVECGGPGIARGATCAAVGEPTHGGWQLRVLLSCSSYRKRNRRSLHCAKVCQISTRGPLNRRSLGYARNDKGEGSASMESSCCMRVVFHLL